MNCRNCSSGRLLEVNGKTSDMCFMSFGEHENDGYVPEGLNLGGGDYLNFTICLDCGQLQGQFPVNDPKFAQKEPI